ncbi:MAG TPA: rhomboid family intramembrane serine protease [Anaeromyxobacteraceae bacterium]|nr:rhomboid family intramembrane serine protease [Anaeromyxobacteraceae bacterium]
MLIPIGLDETRIGRVPWVSIVILGLNVLVFLATSLAGDDRELESRFQAVIEYWAERPYLQMPDEMERRFGLTREALAQATGRALPEPGGPAFEQEHLQSLCDDFVQLMDEQPDRRFALVPERGLLQPGWLTYQFLHGGLGHLVGNMLVFFLVVAPFLEDAWGRPFFLAFYLLGGVVAGLAQALPDGDSPIAIIGASGSISACLGAFALRFAHRRVRMFYWFLLAVRGTFFIPVWAYAFFGLAMDLLGLELSGAGGGVAYAAHVGGFLFGVGTVLAVRATGLETRIAPEGAARWAGSMASSRAEDALARGDAVGAREQYQAALQKHPDDLEAVLGLARLEASRLDRAAATPLVEKLLAARIAARDAAGAREILREMGGAVDAAALRPATAYRAAELAGDPELADRLDEAAAAAGGGIGAKALVRLAERARAKDPARALDFAERVLALEGAPHEIRARAESLAAALRPEVPPPAAHSPIELPVEPPFPPPADEPDERAGALEPGEPVRLVACRLVGASQGGLHLATAGGKRALLAPDRIAALASAVLSELAEGAGTRRNAVLLDVLLAPRPGEATRVLLRIPGHGMALAAIHPGVAPREAFGRVVDGLLAGGARAAPSAEEAAGRPFARFPDLAAFEEAAWGRRLAS